MAGHGPAPPFVPSDPFARGAVVVLTLSSPREKFWGVLLSVSVSTVTAAGMDLHSFDDFMRMLKAGDPPAASLVMFPMHRVERIELDQAAGGLPSLRERFQAGTGLDIAALLGITREGEGPR